MSGIQFSSPVTNQKASPAVYASSLATRPAPKLPGRIFVDTDNPSTGMYRDTGSAWVQISSGSGGSQDLQSVCNVGFLTDTDMTFLYGQSLDTSKIGFFNQDVGNFAFEINKEANEIFKIFAYKPSGADEEYGITFDAPSNTFRIDYNNLNTGLYLSFGNDEFYLGDSGENKSFLKISSITNNKLVWSDGADVSYFTQANEYIVTERNAYEKGFKLDYANENYYFGYPNVTFDTSDIFGIKVDLTANEVTVGDNWVSAKTHIVINSDLNFIKTYANSTEIGLSIDNTLNKYTLGSTTEYIGIDTLNNTLIAGANLLSGSAGGNSGQHLKININGTNYKIALSNP
jgi:hypothetical protein